MLRLFYARLSALKSFPRNSGRSQDNIETLADEIALEMQSGKKIRIILRVKNRFESCRIKFFNLRPSFIFLFLFDILKRNAIRMYSLCCKANLSRCDHKSRRHYSSLRYPESMTARDSGESLPHEAD